MGVILSKQLGPKATQAKPAKKVGQSSDKPIVRKQVLTLTPSILESAPETQMAYIDLNALCVQLKGLAAPRARLHERGFK